MSDEGRSRVSNRTAPSRSVAAFALLAAVRVYRVLTAGRTSPCRFLPSCSEYALEAVESHGAWKGGSLTLRRLARCRPGGGYGFDPVAGKGM